MTILEHAHKIADHHDWDSKEERIEFILKVLKQVQIKAIREVEDRIAYSPDVELLAYAEGLRALKGEK